MSRGKFWLVESIKICNVKVMENEFHFTTTLLYEHFWERMKLVNRDTVLLKGENIFKSYDSKSSLHFSAIVQNSPHLIKNV